ncbi:MAG: DNA repair protein RecO [Eubacteriales bacterium]|nr:DNA repair protein RecO [Eubacteriales bacterium]
MSDLVTVQGVVLSAMSIDEYDRRIVLLTRERGKITAFAKGARRMNSPLMAATGPFVFGNFTLYEGKSSYRVNQAEITYQFSDLAREQPGVYYGFYFLEIADYFGHEGTDEREMMNLLFLTIKALMNKNIDNRLIRCIFELRTLTVQGFMPELFQCSSCGKEPSKEDQIWFSQENHGICLGECARQVPDARRISGAALYAMQFIAAAPMGKLYTFTVKEEVLAELEMIIHRYTKKNTDRRFKSLDILEMMIRN